MPAPLFLLFITLTGFLSSCQAFRLGSSPRVIPLAPPLPRLFQDESSARAQFVQELVRAKRHLADSLVRVQPHLVHDMSWPGVLEISEAKTDSANKSRPVQTPAVQDRIRASAMLDENANIKDEMERMVHLVVPQDVDGYPGHMDFTEPETGHLAGPGVADASLEASGFYGTDAEDRDRGEEDRERRAGEEEWERDGGEDRDRKDSRGGSEYRSSLDILAGNHTSPDLDTMIGYNPSFHLSSSNQPSSSSPYEVPDPRLHEHHVSPVLEVLRRSSISHRPTQATDLHRKPGLEGDKHLDRKGTEDRELWEAEVEEDGHSSGFDVLHASITTTSASPDAAVEARGTATPETDTGTDFALLGSFAKEKTEDEEPHRQQEEEETDISLTHGFTQNPTAPEAGMVPSREPLQPSMEEDDINRVKGVTTEDRGDEEQDGWTKMEPEDKRLVIPLPTNNSQTVEVTDATQDMLETTVPPQRREPQQVLCVEWRWLTARGFVILNMMQNFSCDDFIADRGVRFLKILEQVFARRMNSPEGSWVLYLSKNKDQQHQLLMNVASEHGVIATEEVLGMLGEIRENLNNVGIQNYSAAKSCQPQPSKTRSDYSKLFVVLVIIGSVCMVIITSGFIYICWQRRLPVTKSTFHAEELHFVENGCHDNPTLDVTNDSQPEMQEKKPSTNGLAGGVGGGEESNRWQVFVNQAATGVEEEEQDTHL